MQGHGDRYQNNAIFVHIEGFRSCLSKPSYGAPQWALRVRLMQKERPKSPQKSPFEETRPFWSFWPFWQNWPFWPFWPPISEAGWTPRKQVPLRIRLKSARRSQIRVFVHVNPHRGENPPRDRGPGGSPPSGITAVLIGNVGIERRSKEGREWHTHRDSYRQPSVRRGL